MRSGAYAKNMKKEYIITAKTVEEAMSDAYSKYSADGEVSCEILEMPKKGFLGLGAALAKIKVTVDDGEDDADISSIISDMKAMKVETDKGGDGMDHKETKAAAEKAPAPAKASAPAKAEKPAADKAADAPKPQAKPEPQPKPAQKPVEAAAPAAAPTAPAANAENKESARPEKKYEPITEAEMGFAVEFIQNVITDMGSDGKPVVVKNDEGAFVGINIEGDDTGFLIGHHGETLDAIQFLANLSASRRSPTPDRDFLKIVVDIGNYRAKREETLRALARRMAGKAVKYKRNFVLEPMNPYERRIIHSEVQDIPDVSTHSVGSDENRKVVVTYEGADKQERRRGGRRRNPSYRDRADRAGYNSADAGASETENNQASESVSE